MDFHIDASHGCDPIRPPHLSSSSHSDPSRTGSIEQLSPERPSPPRIPIVVVIEVPTVFRPMRRGRLALEELVEFPAVQPHAPAPGTHIDLNPLPSEDLSVS